MERSDRERMEGNAMKTDSGKKCTVTVSIHSLHTTSPYNLSYYSAHNKPRVTPYIDDYGQANILKCHSEPAVTPYINM